MTSSARRLSALFPLVALAACRSHSTATTAPPAPVAHAPTPAADATAAAPPAPLADAATAAAAPVLPPCTRATRPIAAGRRADITSVTVQRFDDGAPDAGFALVSVAWTVPPMFAHGGDDLAAVTIETNPRQTYALDPTVLDAEEPSNARGLARSPANIARVYAVPVSATSRTLATDQLSRDDDGNDLLEAGDLSVQVASTDPGSDDMVARNVVAGAPFYLRTAYNVTPSFVLGMRAAEGADVVSDTVRFFVVPHGATSVPASRAGDFWPLPVTDPAAIRRAPNPAVALRDLSPEGLEVVSMQDHGYAVAFQYQRRNYLGWLDASHRPVGELTVVPSRGGPDPGKPHLASDGASVLLVFADRAPFANAGDAGRADGGGATPSLYGLMAVRVPFGQAPGTPAPLDVGDAGAGTNVFAPTPASLGDGTWLVGFTVGDVEPRASGGAGQHVYVRRFAADLAPGQRALEMLPGEATSDQRMVATGNGGVALALTRGRMPPRAVTAVMVYCLPIGTPTALWPPNP